MACYAPYELKDRHPYTGEIQKVPCGKCPPCRKRTASAWSFRLRMHEKTTKAAHFVTLTYQDSTVPITPAHYMTLNKKDAQNFFKRLRKSMEPFPRNEQGLIIDPVKYFLCGEYGSKFMRPHYHAIIFNASPELIISAWAIDGKAIGNVHFGEVTPASIGYCLKYMMKEPQVPKHRNDDRLPEFRLMSKGLGLNYITIENIEWHLADKLNRMYLPLEDGQKAAMPRYYKDWIYLDPYEREMIAAHLVSQTTQRAGELERKLTQRYGDAVASIIIQSQVAEYEKMYADAAKRQDL